MNVRFKNKTMNKENLKTVKQHLQVLPLQKRLQAMENIRKESFPMFSKHLEHKCEHKNVLMVQFTFSYTRQGSDYWFKINSKYYVHD